MEQFNHHKFYRNRLLEQEDVLEPRNPDPEDEFEPPVPKGQEEENPDDVKLAQGDLFVAKFISIGVRYYVPFYAEDALKHGYDEYEKAVDAIWDDCIDYMGLKLHLNPDTPQLFEENVPNFVDGDKVISIEDPKASPSNPDEFLVVCPWVEYAQRAPKDDTGVKDWRAYMEGKEEPTPQS